MTALVPTLTPTPTAATVQPQVEPYIHSDIFDRLVQGEDDLPGLIAYGLYQVRKRQWINDYKGANGHLPNHDALKEHSFGYRDVALASLREAADGHLYLFADEMIEKRIDSMKRDALNGRVFDELESLKKRVGKISGYRHHIVGHVLGFFCLVAIVGLVTFSIAHEPTLRDFIFGTQVNLPAKTAN